MGQPPHVPTPESRNLVRLAVAVGMTHEAIGATQFDPPISADTLTRHYPQELEHGKEVALSRVAGVMFAIATDKNHKDCKGAGEFILRAKGGWRTRDEMQHSFGMGETGPAAGDANVTPAKITVEFVSTPTAIPEPT